MTNAQRLNRKRKLESDAHKAFSYYLAVRRSYQRRQATLEQIAHASALLDSALERLNPCIPQSKGPFSPFSPSS